METAPTTIMIDVVTLSVKIQRQRLVDGIFRAGTASEIKSA
jgi:hypothetical protein